MPGSSPGMTSLWDDSSRAENPRLVSPPCPAELAARSPLVAEFACTAAEVCAPSPLLSLTALRSALPLRLKRAQQQHEPPWGRGSILSTSSWPGLARPSTSCQIEKKGVDARVKPGHDEFVGRLKPRRKSTTRVTPNFEGLPRTSIALQILTPSQPPPFRGRELQPRPWRPSHAIDFPHKGEEKRARGQIDPTTASRRYIWRARPSTPPSPHRDRRRSF
jgi:hypothetical protein